MATQIKTGDVVFTNCHKKLSRSCWDKQVRVIGDGRGIFRVLFLEPVYQQRADFTLHVLGDMLGSRRFWVD